MRLWLVVILVAVAGCGGHTPTSPGSPAPEIVRLGPQLLEIEHSPTTEFCGIPTGAGLTVIVTRVTLQWSGSEWIGTPTTAASGDVEVHLRPVGATAMAPFAVTGTISGTAIHQPELFQGVPPWTARVTFPAGRYGTLNGTVTSRSSYDEIRGTGTGSATVSDGAGVSCPGTSFSWMLVPSGA